MCQHYRSVSIRRFPRYTGSPMSAFAAVFSATERVVLGPLVNAGALFATAVSPSSTVTFVNVDSDRDFAHETACIGSNDRHLIVGLGFIVQCCLGLQLAAGRRALNGKRICIRATERVSQCVGGVAAVNIHRCHREHRCLRLPLCSQPPCGWQFQGKRWGFIYVRDRDSDPDCVVNFGGGSGAVGIFAICDGHRHHIGSLGRNSPSKSNSSMVPRFSTGRSCCQCQTTRHRDRYH